MKLFGFEIGRVKKTDNQDQMAQLLGIIGAAMSEAAISQGTVKTVSSRGGRKIKTMAHHHQATDNIIFPACNNVDDPWERARHEKLVGSIEGWFIQGRIDVCVFHTFYSQFLVMQTPSTKDCLEKLKVIHCVDFNRLEPIVFAQIIPMLNHIFSGGRIPLPWDVVAAAQKETLTPQLTKE